MTVTHPTSVTLVTFNGKNGTGTKRGGALAIRLLGLALLLACLCACSNAVPKGPPAYSGTQSPAFIPQGDYRIQVGDALEIKFFYNPELNESLLVRPDGRISLQLAPDVLAAGRTPSELTKALVEAYEAELQRPEIAVIVRSFSNFRIYVDGEVTRPGIIPLAGPMTVLQSLSAAGGAKETARLSEVIVIRRGPDNRPTAFKIDADSASRGLDMGNDVLLMPSDIVYVPRSAVANVNKFIDLYIRRNIPIVTTFGYTYYANAPW